MKNICLSVIKVQSSFSLFIYYILVLVISYLLYLTCYILLVISYLLYLTCYILLVISQYLLYLTSRHVLSSSHRPIFIFCNNCFNCKLQQQVLMTMLLLLLLLMYIQTVRHGFPFQPTALAYDPVQSLLAIGTKTGVLRMYPFNSFMSISTSVPSSDIEEGGGTRGVFTAGRIGRCSKNVWKYLLDFSNILGDAPPPLWDVIFWEKTMGYLSAQSRYTFYVSPEIISVSFFTNCPPLFEKS